MSEINGFVVVNIVAFIYIFSIFHGRYMSVRAASCSEPNVIEGDILVDIKPGRSRRAATSNTKKLWPGGIIPYVIADHFKNKTKDLIRRGMDHWQSYTCLDFVERTEQKDYIYIFSGSGCCSFVGRRGGKQKLSLGLGCNTFGIIVHELGHAVGFWHEQSRPDRDTYVKILYENIHKEDKHNFKKLHHHDINSLQQRYDFHSIMHYGSDFFAKKHGVDTIIPKLRGIKKEELGKQYFSLYTFALSNQDVIQTNLMYRCNIFNENGGTIFANSGSFHSPNYPLPYSVSRDRVWIITNGQSSNSSLTLTFVDFSVGSNDGTGICKNDYVDIRNGKGFLSKYLTQLCGNEKPDPITVLSESVYIRLHSQLLTHKFPEIKKGFLVRFKTDECSQEMTSMQGSFSTPSFPSRYNSNTDCVWQIKVPKGYRIKVTFETVHLQGVDNKKGCLDYIDLRDGDSPFSTFLGRFCGDNNPGVVSSTSTSFRVIFHSSSPHNETSAVGFRASYETTDVDECAEKLSECEQACINTKGGYVCGCRSGYTFIQGLYGACTDINECEENNGGCSHTCENTEGSFFCTCPEGHYLVSDGTVCTDIDECALKPCAQACKNYVGGFECVCNRGYELNDDQRTCRDINECSSSPCPHKCINTEGSYKCLCTAGSIFDKNTTTCKVLPSCGGILSGSSGDISSPSLPRPLPHDIDCFWNIQVKRAIHVNINVMVAWQRDEKCSNHILIWYTSDDNQNTVKICGRDQLDGNLVIKSNDVWIKYHIETARNSEMSLRYTSSTKDAQCKKTLTGATGTIKTPGFPSKYPANTHCEWRIKNTENRRLRLKFNFFDIERESSCKYDYLVITLRTSVRRHSRNMGKFCGSSLERVFRIDPGRELLLVFNSDSTIHRRGFHAEYKMVRN